MSLQVSHGCWDGPYSSFNTWRRAVAKAIGMDLDEHWKELNTKQPVAAKVLAAGVAIPPEYVSRPLVRLLDHSDCDGLIKWEDAGSIADDLETVLDDLPQGGAFSPLAVTWRWIRGLRAAATAKEDVTFS